MRIRKRLDYRILRYTNGYISGNRLTPKRKESQGHLEVVAQRLKRKNERMKLLNIPFKKNASVAQG